MRLLIAVLLLATPAFAATAPPTPAGCVRDNSAVFAVVPEAATDPAKGFQRLDRLPPAAAYLAVYRHVGKCLAPVVVRAEIGNRGR